MRPCAARSEQSASNRKTLSLGFEDGRLMAAAFMSDGDAPIDRRDMALMQTILNIVGAHRPAATRKRSPEKRKARH